MTFEQFQENVQAWSTQRGIYAHSTAKDQALKSVSEIGEMCDNLVKGQNPIDDIGDVIVTLINVALLSGVEMDDAFDHAWSEIKDRTGNMSAGGAWVKD